MIDNVEKTIPSEDIKLAWLAGIVDGEGSIGVYKTHSKRGNFILNLSIVNSDQAIILRIEEILREENIFYCKYLHSNKIPKGYLKTKPCSVITVRRRDEIKTILELILPFLIGIKKLKAQEVLNHLALHPRTLKPVYYCKNCKKPFQGRKKQFCNLQCWHLFARGINNPNYNNGKYIARND